MSIEWHFNHKKQRFVNFFQQFHIILDQIKMACELEIDKEYEVVKSVLQNSDPKLIDSQCSKMLEKEPIAFSKIVDRISESLKSQILNKKMERISSAAMPIREEKSGKQLSRPVSLGKFSSKKTLQKFITPIRADLSNANVSKHEFGQTPNKPLLIRPFPNYQTTAKNEILETPIHQHNFESANSSPQRKKGNFEQNLMTCEKLDRKIQEEALSLLQKTKLQRSPSRKKGSNAKSIIQKSNFDSSPFVMGNLMRRLE